MIDLTPLEVRKKKGDFRRALRGYEPTLVDDFLDIVADRLEQLVRENASLLERSGRLDQQVKDYRERERALTDALVTAQAMREEITERTTREAEALRRSAQEEAESQLRDATQQAGSRVRDAEQRAEEQLRRARQAAESRLREAEEQAAAKLQEAEQDAYRLRSEAVQLRSREEEGLRQLRARQQQLVTSYRTFLERELSELSALAESLHLGAEEEAAEPQPGRKPAAGSAGGGAAAGTIASPAAAAAAAAPAAAAAAASPAAAAAAVSPAEEIAEADEVTGVLPAAPELADEEEPFAPEPVYEEDLEAESGVTRIDPVTLLKSEQPEVAEESGEAAEEEWPSLDMLAEGEEPDFSRPQRTPEALRLPGEEESEPAAGGAAQGGEEETDVETDRLLQNAAKAGYRIELDEDAELLLDEPVAEDADSDNWLDTIIEEEK